MRSSLGIADSQALKADSSAGNVILDADFDQIHRILLNLAKNAYDADASRVKLAAERSDKSLVIAISDDGPGLPEDVRDQLFEEKLRASSVYGHFERNHRLFRRAHLTLGFTGMFRFHERAQRGGIVHRRAIDVRGSPPNRPATLLSSESVELGISADAIHCLDLHGNQYGKVQIAWREAIQYHVTNDQNGITTFRERQSRRCETNGGRDWD